MHGYFIVLIILTSLYKRTIVDALANKLNFSFRFYADRLESAGLLLNAIIGYADLTKHEIKRVKMEWLSAYSIILLVIAADKIAEYVFTF
jgi:uncharacterized protein YqgC (DUF456 family)